MGERRTHPGCSASGFFFSERRYKMADEDSHCTNSGISGDEGHSDPLKVTVEAAARLSTPASVMLRYNGNKGSVLH